jgi:hypothetical protein
MTHDDKGKIKPGSTSDFLDLPAPLRAAGSAEELALLSDGWREERARMRRWDSGCGCAVLGFFFGLFFVAGCGLLVAGIWGFLLDWRANNRYLPNSCVVLDRRLAAGTSEDVVVRGDVPSTVQRPSYHPEIRIRYEVGGREYRVWTYSALVRPSPDRAAQQAIVESFRVGGTYPCWYDPDRPERAILVRVHAPGSHFALLVPFMLLIFGGAGIRLLWKERGNRAHQPGIAGAPRAGG